MSKATVITGAIMLSIGLAAGYWLPKNSVSPAVTEQEAKPLYYRNPMNPNVTSPVPAKDSMGMDYVPVYAEGASSEVAGTVTIDPVVVQNIGVRTAVAKSEPISRTVRTVGRVDFNEERMARIHPKVQGWIEELRVDKTGETVAQDDILLSIYSPQLVSTQQEYLLALNNYSALGDSPIEEIRQGAKDLVKSSRERLQFLDVPEHQIRELEETREIKKKIHIHSPFNGTVLKIGARQGQYVTPQTEIYMLADLNQVWVFADIYENEIPWVKEGDKVEMTIASVPGRTFSGEVSYIYPYSEAKTRTTKVRIVFDNADLLLRPGMFSEVSIFSDTRDNSIVVPSESIVRSGGKPQVFIVRDLGKFEPREVTLGVESDGRIEVISGVSEGEEVVTSAQFLVDSESKLREATAKMMSSLNSVDASTATNNAPQGEPGDTVGEGADEGRMNMDDRSHMDRGHDMDMKDGMQMEEAAGGGMIHD